MSSIRDLILDSARRQGSVTAGEIQEAVGISRQAVNKHIRKLREEGLIRKIGVTRGAKYVIADNDVQAPRRWTATYRNEALQEDQAFAHLRDQLNFGSTLGEQALRIAQYGFTEMLNNAIDHSGSPRVSVSAELDDYDLTLVVLDKGVGIFQHIQDKLGLESEAAALTDLLKGKVTTDPENHTGEGIFFTSKAADLMRISSHRMAICFDNKKDELTTEAIRSLKGTRVEFTVSRRSRKSLREIFDRFGGEEFDYRFSKTRVSVKLSAAGRQGLTSRSEARRLLERLDQFAAVELDFAGVDLIGQGFADEVFRVFRSNHPDIRIAATGCNDAVGAMIEHVQLVDNLE